MSGSGSSHPTLNAESSGDLWCLLTTCPGLRKSSEATDTSYQHQAAGEAVSAYRRGGECVRGATGATTFPACAGDSLNGRPL